MHVCYHHVITDINLYVSNSIKQTNNAMVTDKAIPHMLRNINTQKDPPVRACSFIISVNDPDSSPAYKNVDN